MHCLLIFLILVLGAVPARADSREAREKTKTAMSFLERGNLEQALREFREALEADPKSVEARMGLAFAYDKQGRTEEAIGEYENVLSLQAGNTLALNNLGVLYDKAGRYGEAIERFEKALAQEPANDNARGNLARSIKNKALVDEKNATLKAARKKVEIHPKSPSASYELARLYAAYGEKEQAFEWLDRAVSLGFNDFEYLKRDPAIEPIRMDPRFTLIVKGR